MKKLLLLCAFFTFLSCQKSIEEQAKEAVRAELYKTLLNFDSYEPLETKVDSAFNVAEYDPNLVEFVHKTAKFGDEMTQIGKDLEKAKENVALWEGTQSSYSKYNYDKAVKDRDELTQKLTSLQKEVLYLIQEYHDLAKKWDKSFKGWLVKHKYRAKTNGGQSIISTHCFVFSADFKQCFISEEGEVFKSLREMAEYMQKTASSEEELKMAIERIEASENQ